MFVVKSPNLCLLRSRRVIAGGNDDRRRELGWRRGVQVEAVIGGGDKGGRSQTAATTTTTPLDSKETSNGSVPRGSSSSSEGIEVKAVVTIRKKMKESIGEMVEDRWEYLINGVGQGIQIQLISEQIDPG